MPRMISISFMAGTGFMKCMPMKRSGRSVIAASRVIEIEEVLLAMIASGFRLGTRPAKILRLSSSFSLAASITSSQSPNCSIALAGRDPTQRRDLSLFAQDPLADLPAEEIVDPADRGVERRPGDVRQPDLVARLSRHLRDAATHLPGTDHADPPDRPGSADSRAGRRWWPCVKLRRAVAAQPLAALMRLR